MRCRPLNTGVAGVREMTTKSAQRSPTRHDDVDDDDEEYFYLQYKSVLYPIQRIATCEGEFCSVYTDKIKIKTPSKIIEMKKNPCNIF